MSDERLFSHELEVQFQDWINKKEIRGVLFDLDDTLIKTHDIFDQQKELFFQFCKSIMPDLDLVNFKQRFSEFDNNLFELLGVTPEKWDYVISELSKLYGVDAFKDGLHIMQEVYYTSPKTFEGANETLDLCKKVGLKLGLVTHASQRWTDIKLDTLGLRDYFDVINIVDVYKHKHKGSIHWQEAINSLGIPEPNLVVVGDNLKGDIMAAYETGVRNLVWIYPKFHMYNQGSLPEGVIEIDEIRNLIPELVSSR